MLKKEDNPWLFEILTYNGLKSVNGVISDAELLSIQKLSITSSIGINNYPVSMKGIEQLKNLKQLSIQPANYMDVAKSYERVINNENFSPEKKKQELMYIEQGFNRNQLSDNDLEYLTSQLTNLEVLDLPEQRYITKIKLTNIPKLKTLNLKNCTNLQKVAGLSTIDIIYKYKKEMLTVNLSGCERLEDIESFPLIVNRIICSGSTWHSIEISNVGMYKLLKKYENITDVQNLIFSNDKEKIIENYGSYQESLKFGIDAKSLESKLLTASKAGLEFIKCSENSQGGVYYQTDVNQFCSFKKEVEKLLKQIGAYDKETDAEKLLCVYDWITKNIVYDDEQIDKENNEFGYESKAQGYDKKDEVRSSFRTYQRKKGVCVGIANLFVTMISLLDFDKKIYANTVSCSSKAKDKSSDAKMNIATHEAVQITICREKQSDNNYKVYYFDPTWDLGKNRPKNFCLNKEEFCENHILTIANVNDINSPSVLSKLNYLYYEKEKGREESR